MESKLCWCKWSAIAGKAFPVASRTTCKLSHCLGVWIQCQGQQINLLISLCKNTHETILDDWNQLLFDKLEKRILVIFSVLHYRLFLIKLRRLGTASILFIKKICLSWRGEKKGIILSKIECFRVLTSPNIFFISCMSELKVLLSVWQSLDSDNTGNRCRRHRSRKRWWRE